MYQLREVTEDTDGLSGHDTSDLFVIQTDEAPANRPQIPDTPSGATSIKEDTETLYTSRSTDLDSHEIYSLWDWGDSTSSDRLRPFTSGETVNATHIGN